MKVDIETFCVTIDNYMDRTLRSLDQFVTLWVLMCCEEVIVGGEYGPGTPVDTGFLRAMWWLSIDGAGSSPNLQRPTTQTPGVLFDVPTFTASLVAGNIIALNNNTEYAKYVEFGTEKMGAHGMVSSVANAAQAIAARAAAQLGWTTGSSVQLALAL